MSQTEFKKRLKALMIKQENQVCSDCPERQPRWASLIVPPPGSPPGSLAMGALCCLECSGSHRRLGVHISFVRSITLDSWKEKEVLAMENGGNGKVNAIFEANLHNPSLKPTTGASGSVRERYIRDKYERRKYFDQSVLQNYSHSAEPETIGGHTNSAITTPSRRAPSDAAKLRAQARKRQSRAPPVPRDRSIPTSAPPPPPTAAPVVVDLLDFNATPTDISAPPNPPSAGPSPTLDMFKTMSMTGDSNNGITGSAANSGGVPRSQTTPSGMEAKMSSDDILAMFHTPAPVQQGFGMNGMANNGMQGGNMNMQQMNTGGMNQNNNMMMNHQLQQQMQQMQMMQRQQMMQKQQMMQNNNMNNMGMNQNNNNMMMNQNNMGMPQQNLFGGMQQNNTMGGQGMNQQIQNNNLNNMGGTNSTIHQQPQQNQPMGGMPNNMNMMGGNGMNQGFQSMNMASGNSMNNQSSNNQNFQGGMGGGANNSPNVMGGAANNQQQQFASFGSFQ